jgi:hypothetical protein
VWYSVKQGTTHSSTLHLAHLYTLLFLWPREQHRQQCSWVHDFTGQCLWWLSSRKTFFWALSTWFRVGDSNHNFTDCLLLDFDFFPGYHSDTYNDLPYLDSLHDLTAVETWCHQNMNVFYSDSKKDLKLRCDYCTKFQLFKGTQDVFSRLTPVCCRLLPHNPYRLAQHYKRHIYELSCGCKHQFLWISPIFLH